MLSLLMAFSLFGFGAAQQPWQQTRIGTWRLEVSRDRFDGQVRCRLGGGAMSYARETVTFRFPRGVDTAPAEFRLDLGPAREVRSYIYDLDRQGVVANRGPIDNPSDGRVALPLTALDGARRIDIRPNPSSAPRSFDLSRLPQALEAARTQGCGPVEAF